MTLYRFTVWRGQSDGTLIEATTERPALTDDQVYLKVTHSGVCGTDLHFAQAGIALGHEGVGVVEAVGPKVKKLKMYDNQPSFMKSASLQKPPPFVRFLLLT